MKLEITDAIDKGDKVILEMDYDWEFAAAVAKAFGVKYASKEDIEELIMLVLDNIDLGELGDEVD
jgi:hypothetical protein